MPSDPINHNLEITALKRWETLSRVCERDLAVKKIAFTLITLCNFGVLGGILYLAVNYCPIPAQALLISPFIAGVLGALAYLKFPTCGIHARNYTDYVNPLSLVGRAVAYIFFGPLIYASQSIDWTAYHDPIQANRISGDLKEKSFEEIIRDYGELFSNLTLYGFIGAEYQNTLETFYNRYKPLKAALTFWKKEHLENCAEADAVKKQLSNLAKEWDDFKINFENQLPFPKKPVFDFSKKSTQMRVFARKYCCILPPLQLCSL